MPGLGAHDWTGASHSASCESDWSSRTCTVTSPPPAMATLIAQPQDTPQPVVSPPLEAGEPLPAKISAYYSLVFPDFTYYLQTLTVTIGRRCVPAGTASTSDNPHVDVDLGGLKSVSRLHAKIEYDEEEERFVLLVIGRNGAWVDGVWSGSGSKVPLSDRYVPSPCGACAALTARPARRYRLHPGPSTSSYLRQHLLKTLRPQAQNPLGSEQGLLPLISPRTRHPLLCRLSLHHQRTFLPLPPRYHHFQRWPSQIRTPSHTRRTARSARSRMHHLRPCNHRRSCHRSRS